MAQHLDIQMQGKEHIKGIPYIKKGINLCRLSNGLWCMGCCGIDFMKADSTKRDFIVAFKQSADELKKFERVYDFKRRVNPDELHDCGACKQMVLTDSETDVDKLVKKKHMCFTCPLHPSENNGNEYRIGECDTDFMCQAQHAWQKWDYSEREAFLKFLESKNLDWFEYSKRMNDDSLLNEFIEKW